MQLNLPRTTPKRIDTNKLNQTEQIYANESRQFGKLDTNRGIANKHKQIVVRDRTN